MSSFSKTSIVYNSPNKLIGLPPLYYRWRNCDTNLTSNTAANQYQRQKLIQNTVRVYSSLYTSNLGPLNAFRRPTSATNGVCWNQMSDRPIPSVQRATVPTGTNNSMNSRHHSVTSSRPGCQTPGGIGCDIKHNSYDRYLNRIKGRGPLRRGPIPPNFGSPVPFNPAFPIYGGKTIKTNIVTGCNCPIGNNQELSQEEIEKNTLLYKNLLLQQDPNSPYSFSVGQYVYAIEPGNTYYSKAVVIAVNGDMYTIRFDDGTTDIQNISQLLIYFPCNCTGNSISNILGLNPYSAEFRNFVQTKSTNFCVDDEIISGLLRQY